MQPAGHTQFYTTLTDATLSYCLGDLSGYLADIFVGFRMIDLDHWKP